MLAEQFKQIKQALNHHIKSVDDCRTFVQALTALIQLDQSGRVAQICKDFWKDQKTLELAEKAKDASFWINPFVCI